MLEALRKRVGRVFREIFSPANIDSAYEVEAWCWTLEDILAGEKARQLFSLIRNQQTDLAATQWEYCAEKPHEIGASSDEAIIEDWRRKIELEPNDRLWIYLEGRRRYKTWYWLELNHVEEHPFTAVHIYLCDRFFRYSNRTQSAIKLLESLYSLCKPELLLCVHASDLEKKYLRYVRKETIPTFWQKPAAYVPALGWLTIFGPRYSELIDPKIETVNGFKKRMSDGGIMLLTSSSPLEYGEKHVRMCEEGLKRVLPRKLFFDPANPGGAYVSPEYPEGCRKWVKQDEFEMQVETHLYASGSRMNRMKLIHRPTGISVSGSVVREELDVLEHKLLEELRERVKKSQERQVVNG